MLQYSYVPRQRQSSGSTTLIQRPPCSEREREESLFIHTLLPSINRKEWVDCLRAGIKAQDKSGLLMVKSPAYEPFYPSFISQSRLLK